MMLLASFDDSVNAICMGLNLLWQQVYNNGEVFPNAKYQSCIAHLYCISCVILFIVNRIHLTFGYGSSTQHCHGLLLLAFLNCNS